MQEPMNFSKIYASCFVLQKIKALPHSPTTHPWNREPLNLAAMVKDTKPLAYAANGHSKDFDPSAPPPFKIAEIRAAIPEHCWVKNPWRSLSYVLRDVLVIAALGAAAIHFNNWFFWLLYWPVQGTMFWAIFVLGHDW